MVYKKLTDEPIHEGVLSTDKVILNVNNVVKQADIESTVIAGLVNIPRTFCAKCTGVTDGAMNLTPVTVIDRPFIAGDELFITFSSNANVTNQMFTINGGNCRAYNWEEFCKHYHEDDHVILKCDGDYDLQGGKDFFVEGVASVDKMANVTAELFGSANTNNTDTIDTITEIVTVSAEITV